MTHNCFVILLGCVVVLVTGSVVVAGECPQGDSNENCTLTTDNNEIEALSTQRTQEITTLTSENVDTTPLNMLIEDTTENEFRPTPISSSTTSSTTENSSTTTVSASDSQEETTNITTDENRNVASNSTPSSEMNETTPSITTDNQNMSSSTPFSEMNETTTNADDIQTVSNSTPSSEIKDITTSTDNSQIMSNSTPPIEVKETTTSTDNSQNIISNSTPSSEAKDITTSTENNNVVSISTPSEIKDTTLGITTESNQNIASNTTPSSTTEMLIATTSNVSEEPETTTLNLNIADEQNTISNSTPLKISTEKIITTSEKSQKSTTENLITTTAEASDEEERTTLHDEEEKSKSDSTTPLNSNMEMEHPTQNILINSVIPLKTTTEKLITSTQVSDEPEAMTMHISVNEASMNSPTTETPTEAPMVTTTNVAMEPEGRSFGFDLDEEQNALTNSSVPMHTTEHLITTVADVSDEPKGRALNFTIDDAQNILSNLTNHHHHDYDFTDMIDNNDDDNENFDIGSLNAKILAPKLESHNSTIGICEKGGLTYENGERLENDCDTVCICKNGVMDCAERCSSPYFRKGKKIEDPLCTAKDVEDSCCALLECASDTETEPLEFCSHENNTYNRGDSFNKECSEVCTCEAAGKISCKPRCPPTTKTSDECVELPDPKDPCCKQVFCDVTLDEHDSENEKPEVISKKQKVLSASFINATTIQLTFETKFEDNESLPIIEVSDDKMDWKFYKLFPGDLVFVRENSKYLKLENSDDIVEIQNTEIGPSHEDTVSEDSADCYYKGKTFKEGEEYNDNCTALCVCKNTEMMCLKLQCPTYFGLDVMDSNCIEWETIPPNFQPSPPNCCPSNVRCKNNGSCDFEGIIYKNWEQLPENITGCEKRCYCEMGKVECQNTCPPVPALPPPNLPCPPNLAEISHIPEDECCKGWVCHPQNIPQGPSSPLFPNFQQPQDEISVHTLEPIDSHTVRLAFMVPPIIVGLHGRVEVRYTDKDDDDDDQESWMLQVFAPPNDLIATPSLEFDLLDLKPDTEYKIKITITLRDLHNTPMSRIYKIKTPREVQLTTLPPMIPIEPDLAITDINATWVTVVWRMFTQYELQFIDGVQLRYKEIDGRIYTATPLIHRSVTSYTLENLKPNTKYEVGIFFIPFPDQHTELHTENMLHFTTANEIDTYGFNVSLEISQIKSQSVEISWNGVPYPEDKYVNIYRAIYQSDTGKEDQSTFKIAKRDSPTKTVIMDLKPGTSYRLWLEVYLTNGKIKTSNVQQFITKPRVAPALGASTQQDKLARAEVIEKKGDYYGPLVIVAILAAIAILSTLILLLILVRRHNQNKAAITPPSTRISQSAYDNPTYKVEIQQETMGL